MEVNLITQKELADIVGVSKQYISKLVKQGVFDQCKMSGKLIKDCALKAYFLKKELGNKDFDENFQPVATSKNIKELDEILSQTTSPIQYTQVLKDFWAAKLNEFKFEVEKGKYYPKEEIDKKAERIITAARNKALAFPTKLAPQLIGITDINEAKTILEDAMYEFLTELSRLDYELV